MIGLWIAAAVVLVAVLLWFWTGRRVNVDQARRQFAQQREHLEADFFRIASTSGKPRGLRWSGCDWEALLAFARDRQSGQLTALAGVTISFEAIEGGDMEGLAAVGNLRNASAVFVHDGQRWRATGRVVFNLNPDEVVGRFGQQFERVESA